MTIRSDVTVNLRRVYNPHRTGTNRFRWNVLQRLARSGSPITVGAFVAEHSADVSLSNIQRNEPARAYRYLRYAAEHRYIELPGVVFSTRGPRRSRIIAPIALQAADADLAFTFGVELECFLPRGITHADASRRITDAGVDCRVEHYGHTTRTWWKATSDGSLQDYARGVEFVSPILSGQSGLKQIETVCRALVEMGATVTTKCGYHVHVGLGARSDDPVFIRRLLQLYAYNEDTINRIMPASRRVSQWCSRVRVPGEEFATVGPMLRSIGCDGRRSSARYRKLNLDCWWSQRTAEFRQHSGTIEADKAVNWVLFCLRMVAFAASTEDLPRNPSLERFMQVLEMSAELQTYYSDRARTIAAREQTQRAA